MKKTTLQPININDVYHTIKSPIVSIKSLLFVIGRNKDIQSNEVLKEKISQVDHKVTLLHKRAEIFLNYILYKEEQIEFLYSFFNLSEVLKKNIEDSSLKISLNYTTEKLIMADKDQLQEAFRTIFNEIAASINSNELFIKINFVRRNVVVDFKYNANISEEHNNQPINSDEICVAREQNFIAHKIIEMHGGSIEQIKNNDEVHLKVTLPLKAKTREKK